MNEILTSVATVLVLLAGLAALIGWARRDVLVVPPRLRGHAPVSDRREEVLSRG